MLKRLILILLAMGLIITGMCPYRALAVQQPPQRQVVIFAVEGLDPGDIDPALTPCMWKMTQAGAIGLLNTPSAGLRNTVNTYCTISAGKPALAANDARLNFAARESYNCELAGDIFTRNTGAAPDSNNIIISSIAAITRNNQERNLAQPGRLGDQIHSLGCRTAFIGNSDLPGYYSRAGALLLMDSRGIVDAGAIDDNLSQTSSVMGLATNYQKLVREAVKHKHEVLLVEFGDLYRLDNAGTLFSKPVMSRERKHILKSIDKAMAQIVQNKGLNRTCWYIISPSTSNAAEERGELLTPLIIVKPGFHGILSGISTRRAGIVASLVVSDSILNCLDNNLPESIAANNNPDQLSYIKSLNQRLVFDYVNQAWFMTVVSALIVLMLFLIFYFTFKQKYRTLSKFLMGFVAAVPLSLLLISFNIVNKVSLAAAFLICTALISLLSMYFAKRFKSNLLLPIFLATAICIALDLILGLGMLERSMMSYRIMRGSRYYGLGNEYMGVFISAALGFSAIFLNNAYSAWRRFGVIVFFVITIFVIAYPLFGIDVGGAITAAIALGYTYMQYVNQRINLRKAIVLVIGTILLLAIVAMIDLHQPAELQSHLGKNLNLIINGNYREMFYIITRKLQMQSRVINYTIFGWVLLGALLASLYVVFRPGKVLSGIRNTFPYIYKGLKGLIIAAVVAIIFNDSGLTAAASLFIYSMLIIGYYHGERRFIPTR